MPTTSISATKSANSSSQISAEQPHIFIIEDDNIMAECLARACQDMRCTIFHDAISAMATLGDNLPDLILLDVLLSGPDGFTFLNELISYPDTAAIPVILVTSLTLNTTNLAHYGVRAILFKETMTPQEILSTVRGILYPERK